MRICGHKGCTARVPDDRKDSCCKACRAIYSAAWREKNREKARRISRDSKRKERHEFASEEDRQAYLARQRDITNRYRAKHREEVRARQAAYNRKNGAARRAEAKAMYPDRARRSHRAWCDANPEHVRDYKRRRRLATIEAEREKARTRRRENPDRAKAQDRARYKRDIEKRRIASINVRAKRAGALGSHTIAEWKSVLRHYRRKCVYCGVTLTCKTVSKDHKVPLSRGGRNDITNIVPACRPCNSKKHTRTHEEYVAYLASVGSHAAMLP